MSEGKIWKMKIAARPHKITYNLTFSLVSPYLYVTVQNALTTMP